MGASTTLRCRASCAAGSSRVAASGGLRTRTARGLAQTPQGTANAAFFIQHPTSRSAKTKEGCKRRQTAPTAALRAQQGQEQRSQGLQTEGLSLVSDRSFRNAPPLLGFERQQNAHRGDPRRGRRIIAANICRNTRKQHAAALKTENYWAKKRGENSRCRRSVLLRC